MLTRKQIAVMTSIVKDEECRVETARLYFLEVVACLLENVKIVAEDDLYTECELLALPGYHAMVLEELARVRRLLEDGSDPREAT